ncbi:MAG: hypothetical protein AAGA48_28085 [Myxococcota bacterium]
MSALTTPPDLTIAWNPDGLFARATNERDHPVSTVFWFLAAFWSGLYAMPLGMAVGTSHVTLACLVLALFAGWMARTRAPRALEIHGDALTFRGFDRTRVPLDQVVDVQVEGDRLTVAMDGGEPLWLWVGSWSRPARTWAATIIEQAARRVRNAREFDEQAEAVARQSLAGLRNLKRPIDTTRP